MFCRVGRRALVLAKRSRVEKLALAARVVRRQPAQKRSRSTVDFILAGSARILQAEGYKGATTEKIAGAAGVSIGTLYQYFSCKNDIFSLLLEREAALFIEDMRNVKIDASIGFDANVSRIMQAPRGRLLARAEIFQDFINYVPGAKAKIDRAVEQTALSFKELVSAFRPDIPNRRARTMAVILTMVVEGIGRHSDSSNMESDLLEEYGDMMRKYVLTD
jgi:AcrR family transcriptional regulator